MPALVLLMVAACAEAPEDDVAFSPPSFSWNGKQVLSYSLGDSTTHISIENDSTEFGFISIRGEGGEQLDKMEALFCPKTDWGIDYFTVQEYYNQLFDGNESDSTWSYWNFDNGDGIPKELYLIPNDSNKLEIRVYTASQY